MKPRRILHFIDTGGPGGAETVFLNLVEGLQKRGWESVPVVPRVDWLHEALSGRGLQPLVIKGDRSLDFSYLRALSGLIHDLRPQLVQTHLLTTAVYCSLAGRLTRMPTVSTFHGRVDAPLGDKLRGTKLALLNRSNARIVFVSESLRDWFLGSSQLKAENTRVIPNGLELRCLEPRQARRQRIRHELGVAENDFVLGAVGNIRTSKDYGNLLRATARITNDGFKNLRVFIAGQPDPKISSPLQDLARSLNLEHTVRFLGFRPDVHDLYAAFDLYVLSSSAEGFSLTTIEAMAAELPIVATRCGGPEEILEHGETGLLVPPEDSIALAQAVKALVADPGTRARIGKKARTVAIERFSKRRMIKRYLDLYSGLLD